MSDVKRFGYNYQSNQDMAHEIAKRAKLRDQELFPECTVDASVIELPRVFGKKAGYRPCVSIEGDLTIQEMERRWDEHFQQ